jgi:hypothetical protein
LELKVAVPIALPIAIRNNGRPAWGFGSFNTDAIFPELLELPAVAAVAVIDVGLILIKRKLFSYQPLLKLC